MGILTDETSPPPEAYGAEPLSVEEIDKHPDGPRIWALVLSMRGEHEAAVDLLEERLERAGDVS